MEKYLQKKVFEIGPKIDQFRKQGYGYLETLTEEEISKIIQESNDAYYNNHLQPLMTDNEYDILRDYLDTRFPNHRLKGAIGAPVGRGVVERNKVRLPFEMPSMDKIKPDTGALGLWIRKYGGPYTVSCKLDGVSGLYVMEKGGSGKLYTRGDGVVGQDISHLLSVLQLPVLSGGEGRMAVRGEFIIPKKVFEAKYRGVFANPRNLVSGIINAKKVDEKAVDLHFVAYEVIEPSMTPSRQLRQLSAWGFEVVDYDTVVRGDWGALTNETLSAKLMDWRVNYEYEMDGVIVCDDHIHSRKSGNPEYAFAFKMVISEQMAECKVVDVIWTPSKNGYLKPRVRIEPVSLSGVTIEYATGFNGKFIEEHRIGIGAVIKVIRSGDVIPYIQGVVVPAQIAKMPDVKYQWTDSHVDVVLENSWEDVTVREKNVAGFFVELEVEGLSLGNIRRLFRGGFDTVDKILGMSVRDFEKVEGFKTKMSEKIFGGIRDKVGKASLLKIMVASNKMGKGLGEKKLAPILETYPMILRTSESDQMKISMLMEIKGIGKENAVEFVSNIGGFLAFLRETGLENKLMDLGSGGFDGGERGAVDIIGSAGDGGEVGELYGKKIVMSKVRDKEIIERLVGHYGAKMEETMKKEVFALIIKTHLESSNKTEFAKKNGIPIYTCDEFKTRYFV